MFGDSPRQVGGGHPESLGTCTRWRCCFFGARVDRPATEEGDQLLSSEAVAHPERASGQSLVTDTDRTPGWFLGYPWGVPFAPLLSCSWLHVRDKPLTTRSGPPVRGDAQLSCNGHSLCDARRARMGTLRFNHLGGLDRVLPITRGDSFRFGVTTTYGGPSSHDGQRLPPSRTRASR